MASRITIAFTHPERAALEELARREYRDIRRQAVIIIRRELERHGLLSAENCAGDYRPAEVQDVTG